MSKTTANQIFNRHQADILSERYFSIILGDPGRSLLFLLQAPAIALVIAMAWQNVGHGTNSLHLVLIISAIWFGCLNSCQEIVKEKNIFHRERMFDLNLFSYIYSKAKVLFIFSFLQCLALLAIVHHFVTLKGNLIFLFVFIFLASYAGVMIGLILSALVKTSDQAIMLAPLITIPQIIFSKLIIPEKYLTGIAGKVENLMISKWAYQGIEEVAKNDPQWSAVLVAGLVLIGFCVVFFLLTGMILRMSDKAS